MVVKKQYVDKGINTDPSEVDSLQESNDLNSRRQANGCVKCMARIPYATLIATILCCVGVGVFCGTMYRGVTLTIHMSETFFFHRYVWLGDVQALFVILASFMGGLGLFLLLVGFLATGSTRAKVYKGWKSRLGGRISCLILMVITYVLNLAWMIVLGCLIIVTIIFSIFTNSCNKRDKVCIHLEMFDFLYPNTTKIEQMKLCDPGKIKQFCRDHVEPAEVMYILASISCFLIVISLVNYLMCLTANYSLIKNCKKMEEVNYLMCLSANYTHIKEHKKYMDYQEIQFLQEAELGTLRKERF